MRTTEGWLLDGRLRYAQPEDGYRTGIEPVLLAAGIPAQPGHRVLEAGTGAGAALMCLWSRVPSLAGTGVEADAAMADLARCNIAGNGFAGISIVTADMAVMDGLGLFDHAFSNPPWHDPASTPSPLPRRQLAKQADGRDWTALVRARVQPGGTATLLLPAAQVGDAIAALRPASITLLPFWPKAGRPAKLVLLQARLRRGPDRVLPGLVLHKQDGTFTEEAEAVLRRGDALKL